MRRIERKARITAPPSELFAYLADLDNLSEWQSGVLSTRRTSSGELGVGTTATVVRGMMGQQIEAPLTVTEHAPPHRLVISSEVSGIGAVASLDLAPAEDGKATDLTFAMEIRGSGATGFMVPMIASAAAGDIDSSLERLAARFSPPPD